MEAVIRFNQHETTMPLGVHEREFEVDFGGQLKIMVLKDARGYFVENAVDGWGNNVSHLYRNEPVNVFLNQTNQ